MTLDVDDPAVLYLVSMDQPDLLDLKDVTGVTATSRISARSVPTSAGFGMEMTGIADMVELTPATLSCTPRSTHISVLEGEFMWMCVWVHVSAYVECIYCTIVF